MQCSLQNFANLNLKNIPSSFRKFEHRFRMYCEFMVWLFFCDANFRLTTIFTGKADLFFQNLRERVFENNNNKNKYILRYKRRAPGNLT